MRMHRILLIIVSVILALLSAAFSGANIISSLGIASAIGALIAALVIAVVITLLVAGVYWMFKRKRMPNIHTTVWVLCVILLTLGIFGNLQKTVSTAQQVDQNASNAIENISQIANRLDDEKFDEDGYMREAETKIETQTKTAGIWGEIEKFYRTNTEQDRKLNNTYIRSLDALDWDNLLDVERLVNDTDLTQSRNTVSQAKRELELHSRRYTAFLDSIQGKASKIDLGSIDENEGFAKEVAENLEFTKSQTKEMFSFEKEILELIEQLILFLYHSQGGWWIEDGQLVFETDEQVDVYNGFIEEVQSVTEKQQNFVLKARLQQKKQLEKLKTLFIK